MPEVEWETEGVRAVKRHKDFEVLFSRAQSFHRIIMEEFDFLESARNATGKYDSSRVNYLDVSHHEDFRTAGLAYPNATVQNECFTHRSPARIFRSHLRIEPDTRTLHFMVRRSRWPPGSVFAHWFLHSTFYITLMISTVLGNCLSIVLDLELSPVPANNDIRLYLEYADFCFLCLFIMDIFLKWADNFGDFWHHGWNVFDLIITLASMVGPMVGLLAPDTEDESFEAFLTFVDYFKIIRIFKLLNIVTRIQEVEEIWSAVVQSLGATVFVTAFMGIFFYIFALIGIHLFARHTESHTPGLVYRRAFLNIPHALVTLFQLFTLDHWYDLLAEMAVTMGGYLVPCTYILIWILLASFIFRGVFLGVMVNIFQALREDKKAEDKKQKLSEMLSIFKMDELEKEQMNSEDHLVDWEAEVFHNLEVMESLGAKLSPILWPRDTLYQYLMLLEAFCGNIDERAYILRLIDRALLNFLDS